MTLPQLVLLFLAATSGMSAILSFVFAVVVHNYYPGAMKDNTFSNLLIVSGLVCAASTAVLMVLTWLKSHEKKPLREHMSSRY